MLEFVNFTNLSKAEAIMILSWRNNENIAKFMRTKFIGIDEHFNFLRSLKDTQDKRYFLIKDNKNYIGVIDFINITDNSCEFGLYANPNIFGVGKTLMHAVLAYAFKILNVKEVKACAYNENQKAIALYSLFKFKIIKDNNVITKLKLRKKSAQALIKNYIFLKDEENKQILQIRNLEH